MAGAWRALDLNSCGYISLLGDTRSRAASRRSQEEPGGASRSQEEPAGARRSQQEPGGARRSQEEEPGGAKVMGKGTLALSFP